MSDKSISTYSLLGRWSRRYSWWIIIALLVIAVVALIGGIAAVFFGTSEQQKTLFKIAKFLGAGGTALGSIQTFWKEIYEKVSLIRLHQTRGHVVICGLGEKGMRLVDEYIRISKENKRVVVVESRKDHPDISSCRERGVTVIIGDASDPVILEEANIVCAGFLYAVTGSDQTNIETTRQAEKLLRGTPSDDETIQLRCFTHIVSPSLREIFAVHDLFRKADDKFDASIFNVYEAAARVLLEKYPPDMYSRQQGVTGDTMRIAIIGFGQMGENILKQSARIGHYVEWKNLEISVLDRNLKLPSEKFIAMFGNDDNTSDFIVNDVNIRFVDRDPECLSSLKDIMGVVDSAPVVLYVAVDNDSLGLSLTRHLRTILRSDAIPIVVCMKSQLSELMPRSISANTNTHGFNILDIGCGFQVLHDKVTDALAQKIHMAYSGGKSWDELDETMRDANRWPADHVSVKLRALKCEDTQGDRLEQLCNQDEAIETMSEIENRRWKAERLMSGWRYAPVTDKPKKLHSLLTTKPYHELPEDEKNKDRDMVKNLKSLIESDAWKTYRDFIVNID